MLSLTLLNLSTHHKIGKHYNSAVRMQNTLSPEIVQKDDFSDMVSDVQSLIVKQTLQHFFCKILFT